MCVLIYIKCKLNEMILKSTNRDIYESIDSITSCNDHFIDIIIHNRYNIIITLH